MCRKLELVEKWLSIGRFLTDHWFLFFYIFFFMVCLAMRFSKQRSRKLLLLETVRGYWVGQVIIPTALLLLRQLQQANRPTSFPQEGVSIQADHHAIGENL